MQSTVKPQSKPDRKLMGVVQFASALSLGTLAGFLYSVKRVVPSIQFEFSGATVVAFALAALASVILWRITFKLGTAGDLGEAQAEGVSQTKRKIWLGVLAGILVGALLIAFAYPIRDFSREKASEIGFGAFIAIGFLTVLALLFWRVVRYLESEP